MLLAAKQFILQFKAWEPTPFLVLLGTSGAGKTHLAKRIWEWFQSSGKWWVDSAGINRSLRGDFVRWSDFIQRCREGDSSQIEDMIDDNLLIVDDLAATAEKKGWIV
jgi:DNA replication protein DnaC